MAHGTVAHHSDRELQRKILLALGRRHRDTDPALATHN